MQLLKIVDPQRQQFQGTVESIAALHANKSVGCDRREAAARFLI